MVTICADTIDDDGGAQAMPGGSQEQQPRAIDAGLGREGQSEKQHDKEVSDHAQRAQQQLQGLADDRAAARGKRARAWEIIAAGRSTRCCRRRRRGRIAEVEIAGIDPVPLEQCLDADQLRFDRIAQRGGLLRDGGAAKEDHARQKAGEHQTDNGEAQPMRQPDDMAEHRGHGVESDTKQHAGEDQKQGRGEIPGEHQQRCKCDDADAADRYRPCEITAGGKTILSRACHLVSFLDQFANTVSSNAPGIKHRTGGRMANSGIAE
jgi:hypothetical protein